MSIAKQKSSFLLHASSTEISPPLSQLSQSPRRIENKEKMMAVDSSRVATGPIDLAFQIDEAYEFSAPHFFDFMKEETQEEMKMAEQWFETAFSHAPSLGDDTAFMPRIKMGRSVKLDSLCDFGDADQVQKGAAQDAAPTTSSNMSQAASSLKSSEDPRNLAVSSSLHKDDATGETNYHQKEDRNARVPTIENYEATNPVEKSVHGNHRYCCPRKPSNICSLNSFKEGLKRRSTAEMCISAENSSLMKSVIPSSGTSSSMGAATVQATNSKNQTAKKIASVIRNASSLKLKNKTPSVGEKSAKPTGLRRCPGSIAKNTAAIDIGQENQAIKRQKLDGGRSRQILDVKNMIFHHKSKPGLSSNTTLAASAVKGPRNEKNDAVRRKVYVRDQTIIPFVSMAEMVNRFQSRPREVDLASLNGSISHDDAASIIRRRPKLTLTRPKEPELETAHRVRSVKVKSTSELEEEMLANMPKFKARPVNKKILEAPSLPALPRSTPQPPGFQNQGKLNKLAEPRTPHLETSLRARPPKTKTTEEIELEDLEKMPKFKARPLNKKLATTGTKRSSFDEWETTSTSHVYNESFCPVIQSRIFESKGELGVFCNTKRQVTVPQEFHFATDERIAQPTAVADLFDKERGQEKERKFIEEVVRKQLEEERARIPRANPYPYTTDYPVVPPKPEPKECTKPEPFQLESLMRHEEEMHRKMEETERMEKEEAEMRIFRAQPVLKEDPLPLPEKARKPLTQVQQFALRADHRAVGRAEFDKKAKTLIKEKEMIYKRYREEYEAAQKMEEEKAVKQMRRTMVPQARPIPSFANPFLPQKSHKDTTKPKSPILRVLQRKERRKQAVSTGQLPTAATGAAAHMR
ncbi:hypothetical protein ACLOJK_039336 [Asimina triloba]